MSAHSRLRFTSARKAGTLIIKPLLVAGLLAAPLTCAMAQDASTGQRIAQQGGKGAAPCISCHGAQGEGNAAAGFPRIAGLPAQYFAHQMKSFANGERNSPIMSPIAKVFDDKEAAALADYYSTLSTPASKPAGATASKDQRAQMKRAMQLGTVGDESKRVQACANCHGPQGVGEPPVIPPLAGQHASYLTSSLKAWQDGSRKNDLSGQMQAIAKQLNAQDVAGLSAWYASLPLPAPAGTRTQGAARAAPTPAAGAQAGAQTNAPSSGGQATSPGTGSEQGSGQTGGSQGPGGSAETPGAKQRTP